MPRLYCLPLNIVLKNKPPPRKLIEILLFIRETELSVNSERQALGTHSSVIKIK